MPYVPSHEKLLSLGFERSYHKTWLTIYTDKGSLRIIFWPAEPDKVTLDLKLAEIKFVCPNELFFDQLLAAVGWYQHK